MPQPDGPTSATKSPLLDPQVGLGQRMDLPLAAAIGVRDLFQLDEGIRARCSRVRQRDGDMTAAALMPRAPVGWHPARTMAAWFVGVVQLWRRQICWMACTERPKPRVSGTSDAVAHDEAAAHQRVHRQALHDRAAVQRRDPGERLQLGVVDRPFAVEIDDRDIGVGAGLDHALARIEAPDLRRIGRAPAHVVADAEAAGGHLGEHQRHLRLDAGKAAIDRPDVVAGLLLDASAARGRSRSMSIVPSASAAHSGSWLRFSRTGGIDADDAAEPRIVVGRQQQILRAGLAGDVDAARLGLAQRPQFLGRGDVQDVDARAGPFGQDRGAAHRLDRDHRGPRGEMRQRIDAAGLAHPQSRAAP